MADGPLHPAGGGAKALGHLGIEHLGHGVDDVDVLHRDQNGLPQVLIALDVGGHAHVMDDGGDLRLHAQGVLLPLLVQARGRGHLADALAHGAGPAGLGEIVVRTGVQPVHPVRQLGPGREHQHRRGAALRPQAAQHGEAVQLGQHHVQQDHVINGGQGVVQPRLAVVADVHRIAVQLQQVLEGGGQADLILHHQYAHEITSVCRIARRFCRQRHTGGSPGAPPWSDETDGKRDRVYSPVASAAVRPFSATERMVSTEAVSIW